jgi:hypothetical protein
MRSIYSRPHRGSIYEPASIHDIPQEVLEEALILLPRRDLISASLAWRPRVVNSRFKIDSRRRIEGFVCGYRLKSLVFGDESFQLFLFL